MNEHLQHQPTHAVLEHLLTIASGKMASHSPCDFDKSSRMPTLNPSAKAWDGLGRRLMFNDRVCFKLNSLFISLHWLQHKYFIKHTVSLLNYLIHMVSLFPSFFRSAVISKTKENASTCSIQFACLFHISLRWILLLLLLTFMQPSREKFCGKLFVLKVRPPCADYSFNPLQALWGGEMGRRLRAKVGKGFSLQI